MTENTKTDYSKISEKHSDERTPEKPKMRRYRTIVPNLNVRPSASKNGEPLKLLESVGTVVAIESVRKDGSDSLWGKLSSEPGYICIYDGPQRATFAEEI